MINNGACTGKIRSTPCRSDFADRNRLAMPVFLRAITVPSKAANAPCRPRESGMHANGVAGSELGMRGGADVLTDELRDKCVLHDRLYLILAGPY